MTGASDDAYDLARFVAAQEPFTQKFERSSPPAASAVTGCGSFFRSSKGWAQAPWRSATPSARSPRRAAYLAHPLLGARLKECVGLVNKIEGRSAHEIFGSPDDLKFHSSMTLFAAAAPQEPLFGEALHKYFADRRDPLTLAKL